jgi:NAD(P)-dependent dehydrogenase (short-subunit alcohol dehydrogenase family)
MPDPLVERNAHCGHAGNVTRCGPGKNERSGGPGEPSAAGRSDKINAESRPIDILVNNAGTMTPSNHETTDDVFELQFDRNSIGDFARTSCRSCAQRRTRE